jgi:hypothetical protein
MKGHCCGDDHVFCEDVMNMHTLLMQLMMLRAFEDMEYFDSGLEVCSTDVCELIFSLEE